MSRTTLLSIMCAVSVIFLTSCASVNSRIYAPDQFKTVNMWLLEFAYETGAVEQLQKSSGASEVKVVSKGQYPRHLQLRDDLYYTLKDEYSIPLTKKTAEATGRIQILPIDFDSGGFKLLAVTIVDREGKTIARLKIKNGDRNATFKDDDSFAHYAAKAIAKALKQ